MDQQVTGEEKEKISRSKARHLRRKRLSAARRTLDNNSLPTQFDTDENIAANQESNNILTKSKAKRLRKKRKTQLTNDKSASNSNNQTELSLNNKVETNFSNLLESNLNKCQLQSNVMVVPDSANIVSCITTTEETSEPDRSSNNITSDEHDLVKLENQRDFLNLDDSNISNEYNTQNDPNVTFQSSSDDIHVSNATNFNYDKDNNSLLNTKFNTFPSKIPINSESSEVGDNLNENLEKELRDNSISYNKKVSKPKAETKSQRKEENKNKTKNASHSRHLRSNCPNNATLEYDSDSARDDSNSDLRDHEISTIQADDSSKSITETARAVLNSTELIENEKNLKISSNSKPSSGSEGNTAVIVSKIHSSSDLIISNDSTSYEFEEQEIIGDLISNSISELVQDNLYSTDWREILNTESHNKDKNDKKSIDENSLSLEKQISVANSEDCNLPSTSTNNDVLPIIRHSEDPIKHQTVETSDCGNALRESDRKMNTVEKTRDQIKAEREAKKAAKALAKGKAKTPKPEQKTQAEYSNDKIIVENSSERVQKDVKHNIIEERKPLLAKTTPKTESEISSSSEHKETDAQSKTADGKSKRDSKAERRAKQEAQRAAKEKQLAENNKVKPVNVPKLETSPKPPGGTETIVRKTLIDNNLHEVKLFKHLYHEREMSLVNVPTLNSNIHPAILRLGVQYANKVIIGSNARCVALLAAIKQLIQDFERPSQADFTRGLETSLQECAAYLHHCRPMAVSMQNALKHLKWQMSLISTTTSDEHAKRKLGNAIDTYIREQIQLAGEAISNTIQTKISNGDVILTYAFSSLIHNILIDAYNAGKQFRVIIVDGRPWLEGREHLRRLAKHGIECSYVLINALSFTMPEVSKVFLGAHAILANGAVMSRAGTAQVALMAKAFNVPVLVACETHKSCERVHTDSFVYNEIGDADELANRSSSRSKKSPLLNWKTKKSLDLLNITFDVTPADLVSAVVTELAILPCTSIPVILRIKPSEI